MSDNERSGGDLSRPDLDEETARRIVEAWAGPAEGWGPFLAPDVLYSSSRYGNHTGRDAYVAVVAEAERALGGLRREVQDVIVDSPFIVIRYDSRGIHDREFGGVPPTGRETKTTGIVILQVHDGRVIQAWNTIDHLKRLAQMSDDHPLHRPGDLPSPVADPACPPPTRDEIAAIARQWYTRVWSATPSMEGLLDERLVFHPSIGPDMAGIEGFERGRARWWSAFPDLRYRAGELLVSGDRAAFWFSATGTDRGGFLGNAPTGRPVAFDGVVMFRIACGRISEVWAEADLETIMRQLGRGD